MSQTYLYFRFKMVIIMGIFFFWYCISERNSQVMSLGSWKYLLCNFSYSNLSSVYAVELRKPNGIFLCIVGSITSPIKANLALPTCNVQHTSTQRCMRFLLMCLSFYNCSNCFYASTSQFPSPTGKAKGTLAKSPYDYLWGPVPSSIFKPLGLVLYVQRLSTLQETSLLPICLLGT